MFALETYDYILSQDNCNHIISLFNHDHRKQQGLCGNNELQLTTKQSIDLLCSFNEQEFDQYNNIILPPIQTALDQFVHQYSFLKHQYEWALSTAYNIQLYGDNDGYFSYHCEHSPYHSNRILAWMIYLNDAKCGTEFPYQNTTLQAKQGTVAIWSASWTHPHKGVTPNIGIKYIVTGWCEYKHE